MVIEARIGPAGKEILEGCPAGQKEAARKSLAEKSVPVITEALVTRVGLTEAQPASTSQPARKSITLKTAATDSQVCHPTSDMEPTINISRAGIKAAGLRCMHQPLLAPVQASRAGSRGWQSACWRLSHVSRD